MANSALSERELAIVRRRGVLPIAIVATMDDVLGYAHAPWSLVYDSVGQIMSRRHRHGERPKWVVRRIRVDEPQNMVDRASVPIELRDPFDDQQAVRERRNYVADIADRVIRGEGASVNLSVDFDLEREVLDELWRRWREVSADGFLTRALEAGA